MATPDDGGSKDTAPQSAKLAALDHAVLDHRYGNGWLVAASGVGLLVLVVMVVGMVVGHNGIPYAMPELGLALFVVPLVEIWTRRRAAQGRPSPLDRLQRLDDRVLRRKR